MFKPIDSQIELYEYHGNRYQHWFKSKWLIQYVFVLLVTILVTSVITDIDYLFTLGQLSLLASFIFALSLLANRPLLSPVHAFLVIFYWWFGIAPLFISSYYILSGFTQKALHIQQNSISGVWPVVIGLPLYSVGANIILSIIKKHKISMYWFLPDNSFYKDKTITFYLCISVFAYLLVYVFGLLGIKGIESVNYLGGTKTTIWWIGVIASLQLFGNILKSSLMFSLINSRHHISRFQINIGYLVLIISVISAAVSGWKGAAMLIGLYLLVAYICTYQKAPLLLTIMFLFTFVVLVEPYVKQGRYLAELTKITSQKERISIYSDIIMGKIKVPSISSRNVNIESPFRNIYSLSSSIVNENDYLSGKWGGKTIFWGLASLLPRAIYPEKPDLNIGNFFYHNLKQSNYQTSIYDTQTNISITLPFEIIGNFGIIAGIISFFFIGIFWGGICGYVLSPDKLSSHPLTPLLVGITFNFEMAFGHFLSSLRAYIIPLLVGYLIWQSCKRSL